MTPQKSCDNDKQSDIVNSSDNNTNITSNPKSPRVLHNISINITVAESPICVRRRIHLRSLSDVTPAAGRSPAPRARSHSDRASPVSRAVSPLVARSMTPTVSSVTRALTPVPSPRVRSERSSPARSPRARNANRFRSVDASTVHADPWRKMSDVDLKSVGKRRSDRSRVEDPWIKNSVGRSSDSRSLSLESRRGKLERRAAVECVCRRPGSPRCMSRPQQYTECEPIPLYRAPSKKVVCSVDIEGGDAAKAVDPLLETTC